MRLLEPMDVVRLLVIYVNDAAFYRELKVDVEVTVPTVNYL
jgi:hypothetical protein